MLVDADHHPPLAPPHEVRHPLIVLERKVHAIACRLPVGRIHVVKGVCTVVALSAVQSRKVLNVGAGQPLPSCKEVLFDPQQVDGRTRGLSTERLPVTLPAKA